MTIYITPAVTQQFPKLIYNQSLNIAIIYIYIYIYKTIWSILLFCLININRSSINLFYLSINQSNYLLAINLYNIYQWINVNSIYRNVAARNQNWIWEISINFLSSIVWGVRIQISYSSMSILERKPRFVLVLAWTQLTIHISFWIQCTFFFML